MSTISARRKGGSFSIFLAVGLAGLSMDAAVFAMLTAFTITLAPARAVSITAATLLTWQLNRRFAFAESDRRLLDEALRYGAVALVAQGANYFGFILLCAAMPEVNPIVLLVICSAGVAALSFLGHRLFTFRQP